MQAAVDFPGIPFLGLTETSVLDYNKKKKNEIRKGKREKMGKRFVTEHLICKNCDHYRTFDRLSQWMGFCDEQDRSVPGHDVFCMKFVCSTPNRNWKRDNDIVDTGKEYVSICL